MYIFARSNVYALINLFNDRQPAIGGRFAMATVPFDNQCNTSHAVYLHYNHYYSAILKSNNIGLSDQVRI